MKNLIARRGPSKHRASNQRANCRANRKHFAFVIIGVLTGIAGRIRSLADTRATARRALALAIRANERMDAQDQAWATWNRIMGAGYMVPTGRHLALVAAQSRNDSAPGRGTVPHPAGEPFAEGYGVPSRADLTNPSGNPHEQLTEPSRTRKRRDPDAPFGRDENGQPIAKYGYRKDGRPRQTRPRKKGAPSAHPSSAGKGAAGVHPKPELKSAASTHPLRTPAHIEGVQSTAPLGRSRRSADVQPTAPLACSAAELAAVGHCVATLLKARRRLRVLASCAAAIAVIALAGMVATMMTGVAA